MPEPDTSKSAHHIRWPRLILAVAAFVVFSVGLGYLAELLLAGFSVSVDLPTWLAMLIVFGVLMVVNLSGLPVPFGVSLMLVAAEHWNPALVALAGSLGASLGEFSSYFFGYLGKALSINEDTPGYKLVQSWISRYGMWAIALLSFQFIIPFELGGFIAGLAKMRVSRFLVAIWIGKFPKYLILIYLGAELIHLLPFIHL